MFGLDRGEDVFVLVMGKGWRCGRGSGVCCVVIRVWEALCGFVYRCDVGEDLFECFGESTGIPGSVEEWVIG